MLTPGRKCLAASRPLRSSIAVAPTMHEQVGHLIVGRGKALQMPRRFEPTHDLPSDPGRLESMRICGV
jgi:hypothetical protein